MEKNSPKTLAREASGEDRRRGTSDTVFTIGG